MTLYNYKPENFITQEFVDPYIYAKLKESAIDLIDVRILYTADAVRNYFGKSMTINNWKWRGKRKYSGFRSRYSRIGAIYSQHRFGRAIDFIIKGMTAEEIRYEIYNNPNHEAFKYITRMEKQVNWVHVDVKNYDRSNGIYLFKP